MKILFCSGWKGSGKDTVADFLVKEMGFKRVAFADPLKDQVAQEYGIERSLMDDRILKEKPLLDFPVDPKDEFSRMVAQFMVKEFRSSEGSQPTRAFWVGPDDTFLGVVSKDGVDLVTRLYHTPRSLCILKGSTNRVVSPGYWVSLAAKKMQENKNGLYVISDVRYKSEIKQVTDIVGKSNVMAMRLSRFDTCDSVDPSERDLDDYQFDVVIENRGTKEELYQKVLEAIRNG